MFSQTAFLFYPKTVLFSTPKNSHIYRPGDLSQKGFDLTRYDLSGFERIRVDLNGSLNNLKPSHSLRGLIMQGHIGIL